MTKKEHKIDDGRIEGIKSDLNKLKTLEGLKRFLINELELTQDHINSEDVEILGYKHEKIRDEIFKKLDRKWDGSKKGLEIN